MSLAEIETGLNTLSVPEKLRLMETLWTNLSREEERLASPAWHENVLKERQDAVVAGKDAFVDWESAKQQLRERLK